MGGVTLGNYKSLLVVLEISQILLEILKSEHQKSFSNIKLLKKFHQLLLKIFKW